MTLFHAPEFTANKSKDLSWIIKKVENLLLKYTYRACIKLLFKLKKT